MDWNGLLNFQDDPKRNMLMQVGLGLLAGNQSGNPVMGAMRGFQNAQELQNAMQRQKFLQEQADMQKQEFGLRKSEYERKVAEEASQNAAWQRLGNPNSYLRTQQVTTERPVYAPIPAANGAVAPNFGMNKEMIPTTQEVQSYDESARMKDMWAIPALREKIIAQQFEKKEPIKLGKGDRLIDPETKQEIVGAMPSAEDLPAAVQEYQFAQSQGYKGGFRDWVTEKAKAGASNLNVSVGNEKKYGEQFASELAKSDLALRDTALKAPELADRAIRTISLINSGKVITGTGADYRLEFAKAARLAGLTDGEDASNTEQLAADLANNVLDSIKASGMGGGTGFSNADRDFLERAKGGKINYEAGTLRRLAELSYKAAENSTKAWNKRSKEIPKSATEGTGLDITDVTIPQMPKPTSGQTAPKPPKMGEVRNGYQFIGNPKNPQHYSDPTKWKKVAP